MIEQNISLSIVTSTYNVESFLPRLIESLESQTDKNFEWVVADGASTDNTREILNEAKHKLNSVIIDSKPDFGIYDALNRAIQLSSGEYYIVVGADDILDKNAVLNFKKEIVKSKTEFLSALIRNGNDEVRGPREKQWEWLYGHSAYVSNHAVGLAIKRSLHEKIGWYSKDFPICADRLFILKAIHEGARVSQSSFVAGSFGMEGLSGKDILGTMLEGFRVQMLLRHSFWIQILILFFRLLKHRKRIKAQYKYL